MQRELYGFRVEVDQLSVQVVYSPDGDLDAAWVEDFVKDSEAVRDLLVERRADGFQARAFARGVPQDLTSADERVKRVIIETGRSASAPATVNAEIKERYKIMTRDALDGWIANENELGLDLLVAQLSSSTGVIPFIGAGISAPFGFPQWGEFFKSVAEGHERQEEIARCVDAGNYFKAADILHETTPGPLQRCVEHTFGRMVPLDKLTTGTVSVLPFLTTGPVITTNFDHVLEDAFAAVGRSFAMVIPGIQEDNIVRAIHRNQSALLKIHGDCMDSTSRIFSEWEYGRGYAPEDSRQASLSSLAWLMFTNRPLLFLGCSLDRDRTVDVLKEIHTKLRALTHYTILAAPYETPRRNRRIQELQRCGVCPIWFRPRRFQAIQELLNLAVQRASSQPLRPATTTAASVLPPAGEAAVAAFTGIAMPKLEPAGLPAAIHEQLARMILDGNVIFFLGAYAHLGALPLGNEFYFGLARKYNSPEMQDRAAMARFVEDRFGPSALWREMAATLSTIRIAPSFVYRFLAALPGLLRVARGPEAASVTIFTTNYDTMLEQVFSEANEPFHLFYYQGAGPHEGLFVHRSPDGSLSLIKRPSHVRSLTETGSVIVKMNGGLPWDQGIPESVLIARGDFERLAGKIPDVLPAALQSALRKHSLLFLGHGLAELDVERLVRFSHGESLRPKSWAVQSPAPDQGRLEYLESCGLDVVPEDLTAFMTHLHAAISRAIIAGREPTVASVGITS
jgi:hypothetical protein